MFQRLRQLRQYSLQVYYAGRDPETPYLPRILALLIAAYAFSPIDLIPDFIPILGYLDDLIIVPLGLALVLRLIPDHVMERARLRAEQEIEKPVSYLAAAFVICLWLMISSLFIWYWFRA